MIKPSVSSALSGLLATILTGIVLVSYPFALMMYLQKVALLCVVVACLIVHASTISIGTILTISIQLTKTMLRMHKISPILTISVVGKFLQTMSIPQTLEYAQHHFDVSGLVAAYKESEVYIGEFVEILFSQNILFLIQFNCLVIGTQLLEKALTVFITPSKLMNVVLELVIFVAFTGYYMLQQESFDNPYVVLLVCMCVLYAAYIGCMLRNIAHPLSETTPSHIFTDFANMFIIVSHLMSSIN